jgi:2-iminobutanoate/2-iminopropanoate deaminase
MMSRRKSFDVPGYRHGNNPIPAVTRIENIVMSGGISGVDLTTGRFPDAIEEQCNNMFKLVRTIVETAGATLDDVIKVTVFLKPSISREALNREWVAAFPNEGSRPVRHTLVNEHLAAGMLVQCDVIAVVSS